MQPPVLSKKSQWWVLVTNKHKKTNWRNAISDPTNSSSPNRKAKTWGNSNCHHHTLCWYLASERHLKCHFSTVNQLPHWITTWIPNSPAGHKKRSRFWNHYADYLLHLKTKISAISLYTPPTMPRPKTFQYVSPSFLQNQHYRSSNHRPQWLMETCHWGH